jgi:ParB-like chromosome segregation protein Spo0J
VNPILVGSDHVIIAGHARFAAAQKLGLTEVPVIVLRHLSEAQRRALVIADNRLALNAGWDEDMLRIELAALQEVEFNLDLTGFAEEELARLLAEQQALVGLTDEDAAPALPEVPVTMAGDLWVLGSHRLLLGDATVAADVERLMHGEAADLVFTDPPYNVDYEGYTEDKLKIKSDRMSHAEFQLFLGATFRSYRSLVKTGASLYVCH